MKKFLVLFLAVLLLYISIGVVISKTFGPIGLYYTPDFNKSPSENWNCIKGTIERRFSNNLTPLERLLTEGGRMDATEVVSWLPLLIFKALAWICYLLLVMAANWYHILIPTLTSFLLYFFYFHLRKKGSVTTQ